ncbi:hypothetical protein K438DRAFT_1977384 [Mycena galopus ATCC 62051]|nr:hypothetical protein K438DRAFT_1977384 [Mycena galopus ATCC 62051]
MSPHTAGLFAHIPSTLFAARLLPLPPCPLPPPSPARSPSVVTGFHLPHFERPRPRRAQATSPLRPPPYSYMCSPFVPHSSPCPPTLSPAPLTPNAPAISDARRVPRPSRTPVHPPARKHTRRACMNIVYANPCTHSSLNHARHAPMRVAQTRRTLAHPSRTPTPRARPSHPSRTHTRRAHTPCARKPVAPLAHPHSSRTHTRRTQTVPTPRARTLVAHAHRAHKTPAVASCAPTPVARTRCARAPMPVAPTPCHARKPVARLVSHAPAACTSPPRAPWAAVRPALVEPWRAARPLPGGVERELFAPTPSPLYPCTYEYEW